MKISRILFASDLHGSNLVFKKLLDAAAASQAEAVLIGGDITGKTLTPMVRHAGGLYKAEFKGSARQAFDGDELKQLQDDISNTGSYPIRVELDEYNELQQKKIIELDARPSDCIAIATQQKAPIYVSQEVWDEVDDMSDVLRKMEEEGLKPDPETESED